MMPRAEDARSRASRPSTRATPIWALDGANARNAVLASMRARPVRCRSLCSRRKSRVRGAIARPMSTLPMLRADPFLDGLSLRSRRESIHKATRARDGAGSPYGWTYGRS